MREDELADLQSFETQAKAIVADHTEWVLEQPSTKQMAICIKNTAFGKVRGIPGDEGKYIIISYQPKLAAEPATLPHLRTPPLRNSTTMPGGPHYRRMVQAAIQSRCEMRVRRRLLFTKAIAMSSAMVVSMATLPRSCRASQAWMARRSPR